MTTTTTPTATTTTTTTTVENANVGCVGPTSQQAGTASACEGCPNQGACSSGAYNTPEALARDQAETAALHDNLAPVSHVILVLSGKGGVGKSTVAAQLAQTLAGHAGMATGLLDTDLCGPSAPRMVLGDAALTQTVHKSGSGAWTPVYVPSTNLAVMSISFLLQDANQAVVWRGPRKNALIQQFLTQVDWTGDTGGLDYLLVDTPPGTSDEHISVVQYLQKASTTALAGAILVTTPEEVSLADVRKEISFCQKTKVPILGIVENMGTYQTRVDQLQFTHKETGLDCTETMMETIKAKCPEVLDCLVSSPLFQVAATVKNGGSAAMSGAERMAQDYQIPFWGRLPLDPDLLQACERGQPFVQTHPQAPAAKTLIQWAERLQQQLPVEMEAAPPQQHQQHQ